MSRFVRLWFGLLARSLRSRRRLLLENLALRQQLTVLKRKHPKPKLRAVDKLFWVLARHFWSAWKQSLIVVTPETVIRWHRTGFRMYWSMISKVRKQVGRKRLSGEVRKLIFRMVAENPTWGAPRLHGELLLLGFDVSERTISRWMKRAPRDPRPAKSWRAFLENHREAIAAMDFFTVPTSMFGVLYCFFVISHDRRRILHFNITKHPTSSWIIQQLREAFPFATAPRLLIHDRDAKYGTGPGSHSISEDKRCADFVRKSLAEWCCRALGGQLPQRAARPCDCSIRAAPEAVAFRVRLLLSRGPHASWTGKGNTGVQNSLRDLW
jgi:putative transposase